MGGNAYKAKHKSVGLCVDCSDWALPGRIRCKKHQESLRPLMRKALRKIRARRRDEGRCTSCGVPLHSDMDTGKVKCLNCREGICR